MKKEKSESSRIHQRSTIREDKKYTKEERKQRIDERKRERRKKKW